MSLVSQAFTALGELRLWYNDQSGFAPTLADMPEIIPLRWVYFRDNWEFILDNLKSKIRTYKYPDMLQDQIDSLTELIRLQRHGSYRINPFSKKDILNKYYAIWENIDLVSIPLNKQEEAIASNKLSTIRRYIKSDFVRLRNTISAGRDAIADMVGLSDSAYNTAYDRSAITPLRTARIKDITDMQVLQQSITTIDYILSNTASLSTASVDPFALARVNANNPDIEIQTGLSGQLVRMFYGDSLQSLASRYLGDPDRWLEIAIANGLRAPYVDEIGEAIPFISNGSESQVNIARLDAEGNPNIDKLYINQAVFLQSGTMKFPDQRLIINIKEIPISGEIVVELSGEANMSDYQVVDNAHMRVYKPNTINSNFLVMIPNQNPVQNPSTKETPFFLVSKAEDEKRAGVDLIVDDSHDLVFTATGDFQLSYGLVNAMQAMQLKMVSEQGQLPRHPNFGLPPLLGARSTNPDEIRNALVVGITDLVNSDSRFSRVETIDVRVSQGSAIISVVVRMAGSGALLPLNFTVNTG